MINNKQSPLPNPHLFKIAGFIIAACGILGIVFIKPLISTVFTWINPYEFFSVCIGLFILGVRFKSVILFFRISNIRRVVRIKSGFTFVFCLLCAILLLISGWVYSGPELEDFGIKKPKVDEMGYTEPPVFLPGRPVKLFIGTTQRRLHKESMDGLWKAGDVTAEFMVTDGSRTYPLADVSTIENSESWQDTEEAGGRTKYYNKGSSAGIPQKIINKPFYPWIQFYVPADQSLKGKTGTVSVRLTVTYPFLVSTDKYDLSEANFHENIPFHIASDNEYADYQKYLGAMINWDFFRKIRIYALIVFCFFTLTIRLFLKVDT